MNFAQLRNACQVVGKLEEIKGKFPLQLAYVLVRHTQPGSQIADIDTVFLQHSFHYFTLHYYRYLGIFQLIAKKIAELFFYVKQMLYICKAI